ncbi:Solute carrier family 35 member SLC35F1/F2/F6 [Macleaya cordata]|uniref:Solute carrier family 35 member SLC35F1/F2/F6 n=1 Tax=Macleaya cordata TaxID=56857 RepID=A0A200PZD4_MACCD|nr:Solute carrier family 35 member SLC35F1/F2/F6 [Macleaya cordata]
MNEWRSKKVVGVIFVLFLGQVVSLNLAITSFTSSFLANLNVDAPLTQSLFTYCFLALVYTPIFLYRRQKMLVPWYWYLLLGFIDVQGNFLVVQAYQYSSITSVTLLDCWTTPWVMILTWIFIGTRYTLCQFFGAAMCVAGLCLVLLSDSGVGGSGGKNPLLGDGLVVAGTLCYAMSNVGEEYCVKKKDLVEVLSMLGIFGLLVSICQILLVERNNLEAIKWSPEIISLFGGFALSTFTFYSIVPYVLKLGGSALFNLSLLTSDLWAVIIRIFVYHQKINWLYYLSIVVVALGLIIYSVTDRNSITTTDVENGDVSNQYQVLNEENEDARNEPVVA